MCHGLGEPAKRVEHYLPPLAGSRVDGDLSSSPRHPEDEDAESDQCDDGDPAAFADEDLEAVGDLGAEVPAVLHLVGGTCRVVHEGAEERLDDDEGKDHPEGCAERGLDFCHNVLPSGVSVNILRWL